MTEATEKKRTAAAVSDYKPARNALEATGDKPAREALPVREATIQLWHHQTKEKQEDFFEGKVVVNGAEVRVYGNVNKANDKTFLFLTAQDKDQASLIQNDKEKNAYGVAFNERQDGTIVTGTMMFMISGEARYAHVYGKEMCDLLGVNTSTKPKAEEESTPASSEPGM